MIPFFQVMFWISDKETFVTADELGHDLEHVEVSSVELHGLPLLSFLPVPRALGHLSSVTRNSNDIKFSPYLKESASTIKFKFKWKKQ
jgi:hypothetical protein